MIGLIPASRLLVEFDRAIEVSVIGDGHGRHPEFHGFFHQLLHPDTPVQERVFGVQMEMNEGIAGHRVSSISVR